MALIEFRSKAAAGFYMMPASFSQVCKVWGRGYSEQGSIPPEDLPDLITRLEAAVKLEKERLAEEKRQQELEEKQSSRYLSYAEEDEREKKTHRGRAAGALFRTGVPSAGNDEKVAGCGREHHVGCALAGKQRQ
ncbi:MAG: DUF1840 family protein [Duodenibacillus massiliensis]